MDKFIEMDTMVSKVGHMTVDEWSMKVYGVPVKVYRNSVYQVVVRDMSLKEHGMGTPIVWLSIKRIDRNPIHDWRELQEIKNQLVGRYCEAFEMYPSESRKVDTSNQYHLWVFKDQKYRIPIGFDHRLVLTLDENYADGAKQRIAKQPILDYWIQKIKMAIMKKVVLK